MDSATTTTTMTAPSMAVQLAQRARDEHRFARPEDAQAFFKHAGLSITQAILATRLAFDLSMGAAKTVVSAHAVWAEAAQVGDALHQDLARMRVAHPGVRVHTGAPGAV